MFIHMIGSIIILPMIQRDRDEIIVSILNTTGSGGARKTRNSVQFLSFLLTGSSISEEPYRKGFFGI